MSLLKGHASTTTARKNDRQWGHIHSAGTTAQRAKGTFGTNGTSTIAGPDTVEIFNNGRHVDVVIIDGECAFDSDEWKSLSDPMNRFVSYDWFAEHPNVGYSGNYGYPSMFGGATRTSLFMVCMLVEQLQDNIMDGQMKQTSMD